MVFQNDILAGSSGASGASSVYQIDQSIRFNQADSPYMEKTYGSNGNRQTWTLSFWTKLGKVPPYNTTRAEWFLAYNTTSGAQEDIRIDGSTQQLRWFTHNDGGSGTLADLKTTQLLRDHSAWYHIICVADRTNAVSSERQRIYINGQRVTDFATETYPSQNAEGHIGKSADKHYIGSRGGNVNTRIDGYMAEIVFIDGTALDETSFGEYNSSNIWIPKDVSSLSFGTNGFHIKGESASDLGNDSSSNNNDFTTSGLASDDQRSDSPTNNFATFNPLVASSDTFIYSNGNLKSLSNTSSWAYTGLTQAIKTGTYVIEFDVGTLQSSSSVGVGVCTLDYFTSNQASTTQDDLGQQSDSFLFRDNTGNDATRMFIESSSAITTNSPTLGNNDKFFIYVDADNGKAWVGLYDDSAGTTSIYGSDFDTVGNPATGANPTLSFTSGTEMTIFVQYYNGNGLTIETEPSKMTHSVVSGYNAINTKNLGS